ncbi:MAG: HDOD domain-containing protein [Magnetococcales bacterium]|nr:HDOD domain-containing protein [Magnetococcales bacterium]
MDLSAHGPAMIESLKKEAVASPPMPCGGAGDRRARAAAELERLIISLNRVTSFPTIVLRLNETVENPEHSLEQIAAIIDGDPGLSAKLLRVANSSFYGFPFPVCTTIRAVTMIGTRQLRDLTTAACMIDLFDGIPADLVNMDSFWRHSIACGVTARVLAIARREPNVEQYYLAGLMHDIGRLALYSQASEAMREMLERLQREPGPLYREEERLLGFDHGRLGGHLLRNWNLPPSLFLPVQYHHHPSLSEDYQLMSAVVHVADIVAKCLGFGSSGDSRVPPLDPWAWEAIDLPASVLPKVMDEVARQYAQVVELFIPSGGRR